MTRYDRYHEKCKATPECIERVRKRQRDRHYTKQYNLTQSELERMRNAAKGICAICKEQVDRLNVDHKHGTKQVRGMLCIDCNLGLGRFKDEITRLQNAITYLEEANESMDRR